VSFQKLDSVALANSITYTPAIYSAGSDGSGGFYVPTFSNGSTPAPFRVINWTNSLDFTSNKISPYGRGWICTNTIDMSLATNYTLHMVNYNNDVPIKFSQLEFINIGNTYSVTAQIGARQIYIPAGRTVVTNLSPREEPDITIIGQGGTLIFNAYAGESIAYSTIN
jgi:hypothetical protein